MQKFLILSIDELVKKTNYSKLNNYFAKIRKISIFTEKNKFLKFYCQLLVLLKNSV